MSRLRVPRVFSLSALLAIVIATTLAPALHAETSKLDPRARIELMEILKELKGMGKTIFISSHILSELAELCDSVTIIDAGRIKFSGKKKSTPLSAA